MTPADQPRITLGRTRRNPMQERSQETAQRILQAASHLLADVPLEHVTTVRIAEAAGLSVGALYRFFPDKQAIIDAIAVQRVEEFGRSLEAHLPDLSTISGPDFLSQVIDSFVTFLDAHPDFRAIAFGRLISAPTRQRHTQPDAAAAGLLKRFMIQTLGFTDLATLDVRLRVAIETGERLMAYAYEQPDHEARDQVVAELKMLLSKYLFE